MNNYDVLRPQKGTKEIRRNYISQTLLHDDLDFIMFALRDLLCTFALSFNLLCHPPVKERIFDFNSLM